MDRWIGGWIGGKMDKCGLMEYWVDGYTFHGWMDWVWIGWVDG